MQLSLEDQQRIADIRAKNEAGTATIDDTKEFIRIVRQGRLSAANSTAAAKRSSAKKAIPNADDMMEEMMGGMQ